ncbi:PBP1A family penicillin-binding protein [Enterococcus asini]|uniref:PBP1A family penicillin-binding protein n=1 Tax=Enterococcus asini TaxID=57732 RepID=UPI000E4F94AD|nr:PBP1A family penicillin-binding protein [Enterococcus asini]RGW11906.1 PBP1A family penicillin-binding protein [Enterococcus asini]
MDFQKFWAKTKEVIQNGWQWLKPYLSRFHKARKRIWKKYHVNKILLLLSLVAILVTSSYLFYLSKQVNVSQLEKELKSSTVVYDEADEESGKLLPQKGTYVAIDQISPLIKDGLVATEDRNFYEHHGFDIKGIARAAVRMVINRDTSGGGGSTITQQLAKNAYLTLDQTFTRKAKELFLAIEIEKKYSKDEILEMYLNNSYFGNGVWGVQDAALKYFGVNANEVDLGEAATLIGMLKGPNLYNPIDNVELANKRRNTVLSVMAETGVITKDQKAQTSATNIGDFVYDGYSQSDQGYKYPFFYDAVIDEAVDEYGLSEADVLNKGYKIYTTLNQEMQAQLESTYQQNAVFPENAADGTMPQSASVVLNPNTGGVSALVGRRGEHVFRGFNFATQMKRSPGSTIKPISVYTPALEAGYKPDSILKDQALDFYDVKNYSGTYSESGEVPMYQAVAWSLNAPAVWLLHEIGMDKGYNKAKEFGLSLTEKDKYWGGVALGGLEKGESPLTMAAAYSVFANGGTYYQPHLIRKIVDANGAVIVDNTKVKGKRIISEETANEMTSMLLGTFSNGTAQGANPGYVMAGKTGTTETNFDASKVNDQWIVGYTPNVVISSWLGFEKTSESHYLEGSAGQVVGRVFRNAAANVMPYVKSSQFPVVDAYQTEGQVMTNEEFEEQQSSSEQDSQWQKQVDDFTDKAKDSLSEFGNKVKDATKDIFNSIWGKIQGE